LRNTGAAPERGRGLAGGEERGGEGKKDVWRDPHGAIQCETRTVCKDGLNPTVAPTPGRCENSAMTGLNLPKKCGVMLLPDCTLFPHGGLPLYIFEERYRTMLDDALAGDCVFAVGRVRQSADGGDDEISTVGTVGLVRASKEGKDGTSQLLLHGVIRVRFTEWLEEKPYPFALIEPFTCTQLEGAVGDAAMKTLHGAVEDAISGLPTEVKEGVMAMLGQAGEAGLMADLVGQQFVHDPDLRQKLLETETVGEQIRMLCEFLHSVGEPE